MHALARLPSLLAALAVAGCAAVNYDDLPDDGEFSGSVLVLWVGENETGFGDGRFVFVPVPGDELTLTRANPHATLREIRPGAIYTDGGSVPRAAQAFRGFSPWGYAPAYMVHDWLFVARRCVRDGAATAEEAPVGAMPFRESAEVLGEAIKALIAQQKVRPNDVAPAAITTTVAGPVSRARWEAEGECLAKDRLSEADQAKVDDYLARLGRRVRAFGIEADRERRDVRAVGLVEF